MASEQFSLCWDNFHKNMSSGLNALLETEELVDVTLAVEGKYLKAHKMVLSVCSPYFKELFKANPCQHPIVFMKDVSYVAISDLLQFMYQGEVQVSQDNLTTFIKTAEALQIKGLTGDGNGSADTETDSTQDVKSTSSGGRQHADTDYKPTSRPKKQPVPSPISVPPPMLSKAPKRPRLSVSSNDSQSNPPAAAAASITKTEPISLLPETNAAPVQQFKVEPYDQNQSVTIPDDGDDHFGDETLDDTTVDDTEDYSMMEGEETEPQAGTSADGTGEGQAALKGLIKSVEKLSENVQYLIMMNQHKILEAIVDVDDIQCTNTFEELKDINTSLEDEEQFKTLCVKLSVVGGKDVATCTRRILSKLISHQLSVNLNWTGRNDKCGLQELDNIRRVIIAAVRRNANFKDGTADEIERVIKTWLRNAGDRDGGRVKRRSKNNN